MNKEKQYNWHRIADSEAELSLDGITEVQADGKTLCITKHQDKWLACAAKCPHAGGRMADGYVDALGNIVCPLHRYKFSLQNGRNVSGEGYFLKTFPVEVREDGVFAGIDQNNFFNWLK